MVCITYILLIPGPGCLNFYANKEVFKKILPCCCALAMRNFLKSRSSTKFSISFKVFISFVFVFSTLDQLSTAPRNIKGEVKRSTYILYSMVVRRSFEREMGSCWWLEPGSSDDAVSRLRTEHLNSSGTGCSDSTADNRRAECL